MKVTSQQIYEMLLAGINRQMQTQGTATAQISSGMKFTRPSQDGAGYKKSIDIRHMQSGIGASLTAISTAKSRLGASQNALSSALPILQRAQAIAVQEANAGLTSAERQAAAAEVSTLQNQFLAITNKKFEGAYLFSGTATGTAAYSGNASIGNATYAAGNNTGITNVVQTANPNAVNDTYSITVNAAGTAITSVKNSTGTELLPSAPTGVTLTANSTSTLNLKNGVTLIADVGTIDAASHTAGGTVTVTGAAFGSTASSGTGSYTVGANTSITSVTQTANSNYINDTYTITLNAAGTAISSVKNIAGTELLPSAPTGVTLAAGANTLNLSDGTTLSANYSGTPQANTDGGTFTMTGINAGGTYHYAGDTMDRTVAITPTQTVQTNVRADSTAFNEAFSSMKALYDSLVANNTAGIKSSIDKLKTAGDVMAELTAEVGGRLNSVTLQQQSYQDLKTQTDQLLSQNESTDIPATVTKLTQAQTALQATYSAVSRMSNLSLVNYLK